MTIEIRDASLERSRFALTSDAAAHDAWFRAKVQEALSDPRPAIPHKKVEAHFAKRRAAAQRKIKEQ
jgi:DNA-damage-inducible protein J